MASLSAQATVIRHGRAIMLDVLFAVAQLVCGIGLLYGALLCFAHRNYVDQLHARHDYTSGQDRVPLEDRTLYLKLRVVELREEDASAVLLEKPTP
jgi:hypothetical protein